MLRHLAKTLAANGLRANGRPELGACSALFGSRGLKETTGLVGLEVDPDGRNTVVTKSQEVLAAVREKIPESAQYRANVEATFQHYIDQMKSEASDESVEEGLHFQFEELSKICDEELQLIDKMQEWRPWEVPEGHKPELIAEQSVAERLEADAAAAASSPAK